MMRVQCCEEATASVVVLGGAVRPSVGAIHVRAVRVSVQSGRAVVMVSVVWVVPFMIWDR